MKKIINKIGTILGLVLSAPIKLPGKALNIIRYVALGLGIIESVVNEQEGMIDDGEQKKGGVDETE